MQLVMHMPKENDMYQRSCVRPGPHSMMGLARTGLLAELVCKAAKDKR
jgi:hypothetical protein